MRAMDVMTTDVVTVTPDTVADRRAKCPERARRGTTHHAGADLHDVLMTVGGAGAAPTESWQMAPMGGET